MDYDEEGRETNLSMDYDEEEGVTNREEEQNRSMDYEEEGVTNREEEQNRSMDYEEEGVTNSEEEQKLAKSMENLSFDYDEEEEVNRLTIEQKKWIIHTLDDTDKFSKQNEENFRVGCLLGAAGTGKSTTARRLYHILSREYGNDTKIHWTSTVGASSFEYQDGVTFHSLLGLGRLEGIRDLASLKRKMARYGTQNFLETNHIVFVDEFQRLDMVIFKLILELAQEEKKGWLLLLRDWRCVPSIRS